MPLRPRYSLLTLLVLTALVAGGLKLWHGPHHDVYDEPPRTGWEGYYLYPVIDCIDVFQAEGVRLQVHVERLHGWDEEDQILSLKLVPQQTLTLCHYEKPQAPAKMVLLTPGMRPTWDAMNSNGVRLVHSERVVCFLHGGRQITVVGVEEIPTPGPPTIRQNDPWQPAAPPTTKTWSGIIEPNPLYILTEQGNIYELAVGPLGWEVLKRATVEEMIDAGLRAKTMIELNHLPRQR